MNFNRLKYYPAVFFLLADIAALLIFNNFVVSKSFVIVLVIIFGLFITYRGIDDIFKLFTLFLLMIFVFLIYYKFKPAMEISIKLNMGKYLYDKMQLFNKLDNFNFLNSIILGNREFLKNSIKNTFSLTGSYHFLAISGLHFGIVASIFHLSMSFIRSKIKYYIIIIILFFYLITVNFYISAFRAFLMIFFYYLGKIFEKKTYSLNIWALSSLVLLLINANYINQISFWMSILATLGIILSLEYIEKIENIFFKFLFISVFAQLFLLPILLVYFNHVNIISPLVNTVGIIFIYPILFIGFILLLPLPVVSSKVLVLVVEKLIEYFISFVSFFNKDMFIINFELDKYYLYFYYLGIISLFFYLKYIIKSSQKENF
ncbi:MAG: ComEC/Rec2 family competence protein [Candidatus Mcinerneyibacterium aminivorans]|uniref:ComEC/Rec2 family competence protein n=1 Tax=Candidatus Mcinerneyibacterium aminivorans TaxID=2703815 RepID=A0A5D0MKZ4_9BACT|nr:MAG: ComEC/Rec2 family competence protein [Candidatus Mcinerneyibacterium aminivorans]